MLEPRYNPESVEAKIYSWWEAKGYFKAQNASTKTPYCIILPPPNVTGSLHLGHALNHTIQDTLIRWKRMSGFNALWLPGTDHAGIATQNVVEKELKKEGLHRKDLGREKFVARVWEWKQKYGDRIVHQMKRLGDSCDWDRLTFTLDEGVSKAVRRVFASLYKKGKIYRGKRLVNWCPRCETAVSDLEVEHQETKGSLWHIRYPVVGGGELVVATTRPETLLGDSAVAIHPEDDRYKAYHGKKVALPLTQRQIPIIVDDYVDREFGSGVVKITPGHDFNDYEIGNRHQLPQINILNTNGTLNSTAGAFAGLSVQEARKKVVDALTEVNLLVKQEDHRNSVGRCERCQSVIEPYLSEQWYVAIKDLAVPGVRVAETETVVFEPENWTKTYLHWMNNIQDWCISRQLWWGHRIPAWTCSKKHITVEETTPSQCETCGDKNLVQDEDVLDTWFSSQLWPFSTLGWPEKTPQLETFYPSNVLVTGHDIIFFWVARMIMSGIEFMGNVPFHRVFLTGLVRDSQGRKMSKSLGNSIDPIDMIEKYGADALRFTILCQIATGKDLKFSEARLEGYRNFINKIWNATRFSLSALEDFQAPAGGRPGPKLGLADQWIIHRLGEVEEFVDDSLENHRFSDAANRLYDFVWHDFCDWYLEFIKPTIYGQPSDERTSTQFVLALLLNRIMRLLHPMIPHVTEEIFQKLPIRGEACIMAEYPTPALDKELLALGSAAAAQEFEAIKQVLSAVRNIRGENQIKPGEKIRIRVVSSDGEVQSYLKSNMDSVLRLGGLQSCEVGSDSGSLKKCAVTPVMIRGGRTLVVVPLEGLVDLEEESKRLQKVIDKIEKEAQGLRSKLSNENFVKNAPDEVVAEARVQLQGHEEKMNELKASLERLA